MHGPTYIKFVDGKQIVDT